MNYLGRKIYYDLASGNVLVDTGERVGDVQETTEDQDFQNYSALQGRTQSSVGVLTLPYGQDVSNFSKYPYHIDPTTNLVVWDTSIDPTVGTLPVIQAAKISQLEDFYNQTLADGFVSSGTGTSYQYGFSSEDQANMAQQLIMVNAGLAVYPIQWGIKGGTVIDHDYAQFRQVCADANQFKWDQVNHLRSLVGQVQQATTIDVVNAITW